jgi:hypothetical protein
MSASTQIAGAGPDRLAKLVHTRSSEAAFCDRLGLGNPNHQRVA